MSWSVGAIWSARQLAGEHGVMDELGVVVGCGRPVFAVGDARHDQVAPIISCCGTLFRRGRTYSVLGTLAIGWRGSACCSSPCSPSATSTFRRPDRRRIHPTKEYPMEWLVSVDDHVIEPRDVWTDRVPAKYKDAAPHVVLIDEVGEDNIMVETDYPHSDTTWPDSQKLMNDRVAEAGLTDSQIYKVLRGNAERLFQFTPAPVPQQF
jgi:hypothetical protein